MNLSIWSNHVDTIKIKILDFLLIMTRFNLIRPKRRCLFFFFEKYERDYFSDFGEECFHFLEFGRERRKSERIRTHQPVHHFGIYPHVVSRYAGHAISRCVSFAFPWKYERNAHPIEDPAFSERAIFLISAISALSDFFIFSFNGSLQIGSYVDLLSISVDITSSSSHMMPAISWPRA